MYVCMYVLLIGVMFVSLTHLSKMRSAPQKKKKMPDGYYPVINDEAENGQDLTGYSNEATLLCV